MVDAVTSQKLVDGPRNVVYSFTNLSDGTGESAVMKVDVSGLEGAPTEVRIDKIQYDCQGMQVEVLWDADTDVIAAIVGPGQGCLDYKAFGGLINNAGAGVTGDIRFTTVGHSANDSYNIVLSMVKK